MLSDAHAVGRRQIELLAGLYVEGTVPRVDIAHGVRAALRRRVRIGLESGKQLHFEGPELGLGVSVTIEAIGEPGDNGEHADPAE